MKRLPGAMPLLVLCLLTMFHGALFIETEALFVRTAGAPHEATVAFTNYSPAIPYLIKVQNGPDGYDRSSSASVSLLLNGRQIFSPNDFNPRSNGSKNR